jgi:Putative adhesin
MREHTFEMPADPRLNVGLPAGEIDVETQPGSEAFVRLSPIVDDEESRRAIERAHVELHGSELVVEVKEKGLRFRGHPEIRVEIRCPDNTGARLHAASADIRVRGRLGETKTHVASGDVELDRVEGRLDAHSASGDLRVGFVGGDAAIHSASGDVELRSSEAGVSVQSASGDVELGDAGGGPVKLKTVSGDVRIAVRAGRRVAVDVRTVSGEAISDIPLDDGGGEAGDAPLVEIQVNGVSGDVRIERAAAVQALEA